MEQYEDEEGDAGRPRVLSNTQVLAFIGGYWSRRPWLIGATVILMLASIGFEMAVPRASQGLVDAAVQGPTRVAQAWRAWGFFAVVYLGYALARNTSVRPWIPLAAWTMRDITNDGFARVQAFSADWHGDTFAGATVRRLSRAM